jgi:hypothetical protein
VGSGSGTTLADSVAEAVPVDVTYGAKPAARKRRRSIANSEGSSMRTVCSRVDATLRCVT